MNASYLYRGINGAHPGLALALRGIVIPGNLEGVVTPEDHNEGGPEAYSPYTSWTHSIEIARGYARRVPGGVVLRVPAGNPKSSDTWHWEWSPDEFYEQEILLYGVRMDAEVIE